MRYRYILALIQSILCASCVTYTVRPISIPQFEIMPVRQTEQAISIGVDPFVQADRLKEVFDEVLTERGILPVQVFVRNQGDKPIHLSWFTYPTALVLPDATEIRHTMPVSHPGSAPRSQFCENPMFHAGSMPGPALLVILGCGVYGIGSGANYQTELTRWQDYSGKELRNATLSKDEWTHGFVFFNIPEEKRHFTEATLLFRFAEGDETERPERTVRLPLTGLNLK